MYGIAMKQMRCATDKRRRQREHHQAKEKRSTSVDSFKKALKTYPFRESSFFLLISIHTC